MSKIISSKASVIKSHGMKQFASYLVVGAGATIVEWVLFWLFTYPLSLNQNLSFTIAFILSTAVNQLLGRLLTFKNSELKGKTSSKKLDFIKETVLIYVVALIGYLLNLLILNALTSLLSLDPMISKMIATLIVFFWNFFARKLGIYKDTSAKKEAA